MQPNFSLPILMEHFTTHDKMECADLNLDQFGCKLQPSKFGFANSYSKALKSLLYVEVQSIRLPFCYAS